MSEPTYEVWHFDGRAPERLGTAEDEGAGRRIWRNARHAVIAKGGVVLEHREGTGPAQMKALRAAVAEAHRAAGGAPPEPLYIGPANRDGTRRLQVESRALAPVEEVPPVVVTPLLTPFDEAPAVDVVVTRKPVPTPATETPTMTTPTPGRCPCGAASAPTAGPGGRPSTPGWADLCTEHRNRAMGRRRRTGESDASAREWSLGYDSGQPAASKPTSKLAPVGRAPKARAAEAPVSDLLALVRRQRAVVDALGGIDQAERVAAAAARVGGAAALVQLVDELAGSV